MTEERCARCDNPIRGYGHNGQPLVNGRVCDECNNAVILERMRQAMGEDDDKIDKWMLTLKYCGNHPFDPQRDPQRDPNRPYPTDPNPYAEEDDESDWVKTLKVDDDDRPMTPDEFMHRDVPAGLEEYMNEHFDKRPGFEGRWFETYLYASRGRKALINAFFEGVVNGPQRYQVGSWTHFRTIRAMKSVLRGSNEVMPGIEEEAEDNHRDEEARVAELNQQQLHEQAIDAQLRYEEE